MAFLLGKFAGSWDRAIIAEADGLRNCGIAELQIEDYRLKIED
jgi:hypothetical protein